MLGQGDEVIGVIAVLGVEIEAGVDVANHDCCSLIVRKECLAEFVRNIFILRVVRKPLE
jgi:hypothetical protein